jgi:hypothetical protein
MTPFTSLNTAVAPPFVPQAALPLLPTQVPFESPLLPLQTEKLARMNQTVIQLKPSNPEYLELNFAVPDLISYVEKELSEKLGESIECLIIGSLADPFDEEFNDIDLKIYTKNPNYTLIRNALVQFVEEALKKHPQFSAAKKPLTTDIAALYFNDQCIFSDRSGAFYGLQGVSFTIFNANMPHLHSVSPSDGVQIFRSRNTMRMALGEHFALDADSFQTALNSCRRGEYVVFNPEIVRDLFLRLRFKRTKGRAIEEQLFTYSISKAHHDYSSKEQFKAKFYHHQHQHYPHLEGKTINFLNWLHSFQHDPQRCQWLAEAWIETQSSCDLAKLIIAQPQNTRLFLDFIRGLFFCTNPAMALTCHEDSRWNKRTYYLDFPPYGSSMQISCTLLDCFAYLPTDLRPFEGILKALKIDTEFLKEGAIEHIGEILLKAFHPDYYNEDPRPIYVRLHFKKTANMLQLFYQIARADLHYCYVQNANVKDQGLTHCIHLILKALRSPDTITIQDVAQLVESPSLFLQKEALVKSGLAQTYQVALTHLTPALVTAILKNPTLLISAHSLYQAVQKYLSKEEERVVVQALFFAFNQLPKDEPLLEWSYPFFAMALSNHYLEEELFYSTVHHLCQDPSSTHIAQKYVEIFATYATPEIFADFFLPLFFSLEANEVRSSLLLGIYQRSDLFAQVLHSGGENLSQVIVAFEIPLESALDLLQAALKASECPVLVASAKEKMKLGIKSKNAALSERLALVAIPLLKKEPTFHKYDNLALELLSQGSLVGLELLQCFEFSNQVRAQKLHDAILERLVLAALQENVQLTQPLIKALILINQQIPLIEIPADVEKADLQDLILALRKIISKLDPKLREKDAFKQCTATAKELAAKKLDCLPWSKKIDFLAQQAISSLSERHLKQLIQTLKNGDLASQENCPFPLLMQVLQALVKQPALAQVFFEQLYALNLLDQSQVEQMALWLLQIYAQSESVNKFKRVLVKILMVNQNLGQFCSSALFLHTLKSMAAGSIEELKFVINQVELLIKKQPQLNHQPLIDLTLKACLANKDAVSIGFAFIQDLLKHDNINVDTIHPYLMQFIEVLAPLWKKAGPHDKEMETFLNLLLEKKYACLLAKQTLVDFLQKIHKLQKNNNTFIWDTLQQARHTSKLTLAEYLLSLSASTSEESIRSAAYLLITYYDRENAACESQADKDQLQACLIKTFGQSQDKELFIPVCQSLVQGSINSENALELLQVFCLLPIHEWDASFSELVLNLTKTLFEAAQNHKDQLAVNVKNLIDHLTTSQNEQVLKNTIKILVIYLYFLGNRANIECCVENLFKLCDRKDCMLYILPLKIYQDACASGKWTKEELEPFAKRIDLLGLKLYKIIGQKIKEVVAKKNSSELTDSLQKEFIEIGNLLKESIELFRSTYPEKGQQLFQAYLTASAQLINFDNRESLKMLAELTDHALLQSPLYKIKRIGACQVAVLNDQEKIAMDQNLHFIFQMLIGYLLSSSHPLALIGAFEYLKEWHKKPFERGDDVKALLAFHRKIGIAYICQALSQDQLKVFQEEYLKSLQDFLDSNRAENVNIAQAFLDHIEMLFKITLILPELIPSLATSKGIKTVKKISDGLKKTSVCNLTDLIKKCLINRPDLRTLNAAVHIQNTSHDLFWGISLFQRPSQFDYFLSPKTSRVLSNKIAFGLLNLYCMHSKRVEAKVNNFMYIASQATHLTSLFASLNKTYVPLLGELDRKEFAQKHDQMINQYLSKIDYQRIEMIKDETKEQVRTYIVEWNAAAASKPEVKDKK